MKGMCAWARGSRLLKAVAIGVVVGGLFAVAQGTKATSAPAIRPNMICKNRWRND
jgi:hypothetical protein